MAQMTRQNGQAILTTTRQQSYAVIATCMILCGALIAWKGRIPLRKNPSTQTKPKRSCRFDLTTAKSAKLALSDGRELGYAEYGTPTGTPVIFLHGAPGSRLDAAHLELAARDLGIRIISVDRPGIGWSSPKPDRKLLDHADDVQQLTTYLGLNEYSILVCSLVVVCGKY